MPEIGRVVLLGVVLMAMLAPSSAEAAKVVNGDFESGTLNGWSVYQANPFGDWFAYQGTDTPISANRKKQSQARTDPVQPPPQGTYATVTDEIEPDTLILYQDVALEPGLDHQLSLVAYYDTYKPIAIPTPDTLSVADEALRLPNGEFQENQQFRIDVMRPDAPLESLDPADILRTVFATKPGDRPTMTPKRLTANLSAFAGQTVRLRISNAVTGEIFNAGVDAVSISDTLPGPQSRGSKHGPILFGFGKARANRHNGTVTLRVRVSGSGLLRAKRASTPAGTAGKSKAGKLRKPIEPVTIPVASAKTATIHLRPTPPARAILAREHKLRVRVGVTYMPTGGSPETASLPVVFKLAKSLHRRR
ncbi:MAG TPA: hypothetical protein VK471_05165 [Solirubrobacterales bacterium]|nr:hypothetical protein [Solirubrobacterales bacterium]